jgi:hypothetical protein
MPFLSRVSRLIFKYLRIPTTRLQYDIHLALICFLHYKTLKLQNISLFTLCNTIAFSPCEVCKS